MSPIPFVAEKLIRKLKLPLLLLVSAVAAAMTARAERPADLGGQFRMPPREAHPWVYWVWTGDTTPACITRDLGQMKAKGIAGCILYDVQTGRGVNWWNKNAVLVGKDYRAVATDDYRSEYYTPIPTGPLESWSPRWRELVRFAAQECGRLGVEFVISDGLANTSGPIPVEYGEQELVWSGMSLRGGQLYDGRLPDPELNATRRKFPRRIVAVLAVPDRAGFSNDQVINLTTNADAEGHLYWNAPAGDWRILCFLQVPTGARNAWGYFNDSLSVEAMDKTWDVTMAPLLKEMTPEERRGLKGIEDDSWEAGKTTWTKRFPEEFKKRRGYEIIPYLPFIAGTNLADADTRTRVLRDYALTISDLIADNHYGYLNHLAEENGLVLHSEAAGPNYDCADLLKTSSRVADAMAEFWMPSAHRPTMDSRFLLRNAANANHLYGRVVTMCESFSSLGPEWEETPFTMKPVADQAFCDGLNKICLHNFSQSPSLTAKPGYVYVAGTHYEPGITWWDETPAFNLYLERCSAMLQAGKFVADAVLYHGDNIGHGEQRKTIPATLGEGYDHDDCNSEVLLTRMSVSAGRVMLPVGMSYRLLVLPEQTSMPFEDLKKVAALAEAGATIVGPPPTGMAGMALHPDDQERFKALAARLWNGLDGTHVTQKRFGTGQLVWGKTGRQVLQSENVPPDFEARGVSDGGTIDWIHRQTKDTEIYYVASRWAHPETVTCAFRVSGKQPELWDPVTGGMRDATAFQQEDNRTLVPLEFDPCGSVFVVFRRPIPMTLSGTTTSNYPGTSLLATLSGPWTVNFNPKWGGPEQAVFAELVDWTNSPEPGIKYYSGTAVYHKQFDLPAASANGRLILDLGEVDDLASVRLNGKDLGVLWTKPARVEIGAAAKAGKNDLEIAVVNLWPNRLIRDESLPKEQRLTETNVHKFGPASPLLPSGLIGPVRLLVALAPPGK